MGSWFTFLQAFLVKAKLSVVSVCTTHNADTLNLLQLIEMPIAGSPHFKGSPFKTGRESDISPLFGKLSSTGFGLNRTMYLLFFEPRIPLFPWLVLLAVFIKVRNGRPCSFSASLTYHIIEVFSKLKLPCQYSNMHFTRIYQCLCCPSSISGNCSEHNDQCE
ncbi:hypothetical protein E5S67_05391 [Microcoleus sp. IPMA8]|uniref:Secreted protein n=1 Tax=Microcoleus asticus IPMA8 TaxID=2563858 RepID=A0ABX2D4N3_9CYAN|nr:hypothetical protein [Microcoleus asticus IPMA8]